MQRRYQRRAQSSVLEHLPSVASGRCCRRRHFQRWLNIFRSDFCFFGLSKIPDDFSGNVFSAGISDKVR
ncbi:hypothetical protein RHGRI_004479 [Rhododendron griersonianum]|uniref:Uncharacterized protein n=1 Tax=Rhododendron griersonianum TaxID=479676 RepID=A0AAV6L8T3_9ERIC|nr:hypothetical protein RHGRI_004479 [Rhododendron griersonianum]